MPDENRFAGLGSELTDERADAETSSTDADDSNDASTESSSKPAFEFDETTPKSIYVRPSTIELLEDTEFEIESLLRREHGIRDVTGREFHDALVHVVAEHPERIAEQILATREE